MTGGKNEKNWQKLIAATVSQLNCNFNLWKRSFRARLSFQNWKLKLRKTKPEPSVPTRGRSEHNPTQAERGRHRRAADLSHPSEVRFVLQNIAFRASSISQKRISCETSLKLKVEVVKRKLPCETSFKTESWAHLSSFSYHPHLKSLISTESHPNSPWDLLTLN